MKMQTLALIGMVTTAVGGIAWVFLYPLLSGERKAEQRRASLTRAEPVAARSSVRVQRTRREQVEETLKDLDIKQKRKSPPLHIKIQQAGLSWWKYQFLMIAAGLGLFAFATAFVLSGALLPALAAGFSAG